MLYTKLQKIAVALKYKYGEDTAPKVVASGRGKIAQTIIKKAEDAAVPVHRDTHLAILLNQVKVGHTIPEELYDLVAQLIAMIYRMDSQMSH